MSFFSLVLMAKLGKLWWQNWEKSDSMSRITEINVTGDNQLYFVINSLEQSVFRGIFYEAKLCMAEGRKTDAFGI